jgi:hypothetical protein
MIVRGPVRKSAIDIKTLNLDHSIILGGCGSKKGQVQFWSHKITSPDVPEIVQSGNTYFEGLSHVSLRLFQLITTGEADLISCCPVFRSTDLLIIFL